MSDQAEGLRRLVRTRAAIGGVGAGPSSTVGGGAGPPRAAPGAGPPRGWPAGLLAAIASASARARLDRRRGVGPRPPSRTDPADSPA